MILCHKHQFIFLKTRKTAGTSLEISLAGLCQRGDIITRITKEDEAARKKLGSLGEQNIYLPPWRYKWNDWGTLINRRSLKKYYNHMPAKEILALTPAGLWDKYYTFAFERNPWDKVVSHYHWKGGDERFGSMKSYLLKGPVELLRSYDLYSLNNYPAVDKVYKMEEMTAALADISEKLNLEKKLEMPKYKAKSTSRKDRRHYREILTEEEAEMIAIIFAREIKWMGYEF